MCMNMCSQMIEPNETLKKMIIMLRVILGISGALIIGKAIFWGQTGLSMNLFTDVICLFIIIMTNVNLLYSCGMMLLFFLIIRLFSCFFLLGTLIQKAFISQSPTFTNIDYWLLGFNTFEFCFHIFSIAIIFPMYKEMKAHYIEQGGGRSAPQEGGAGSNYQQHRDQENQVSHNQQPPSSNSGNYRAFQGRGVAVGGN